LHTPFAFPNYIIITNDLIFFTANMISTAKAKF